MKPAGAKDIATVLVLAPVFGVLTIATLSVIIVHSWWRKAQRGFADALSEFQHTTRPRDVQ